MLKLTTSFIRRMHPNCITQTELYLPPLVKQNGGVDCCAYCDKELR